MNSTGLPNGRSVRSEGVELLRQALEATRRTLATRDEAICDLQEWFAALQDGYWHHEVPVTKSDLVTMLPHLYEHILQRDEELQAAIGALQASLETLTQENGTAKGSTATAERLDHREYEQLLQRIQRVVASAVPFGSTVVVASRGDGELLKLNGRRGWHFPQTANGTYAGHYPASSGEAIAHLEALRAKGADFLLLPSTAFWWLDYYSDFRQHLENHYRLVVRQEDTCAIFALRETPRSDAVEDLKRVHDHHLARQLREIVHNILPPDAAVLVVSKGDSELVQLVGPKAQHFPQAEGGGYAGYYPADSAAAIAHLEELRRKGADYLLFPATAFWWLEYYKEFAKYLQKHCRRVVQQKNHCLIFSLQDTAYELRAGGHGKDKGKQSWMAKATLNQERN